MPSSCDSDRSSSPSLISSLRSFRFQNKNLPYTPNSSSHSPLPPSSPVVRSTVGFVPETPDLQKSGSLQSSPLSTNSRSKSPSLISPSSAVSSTSSPLFSAAKSSPPESKSFSREKHYLFIERVTSKFKQALDEISGETVHVALKSEDIQRFQIELSCKHPEIFLKWDNEVIECSEKVETNSTKEDTLKVRRDYLKKLLELFKKGTGFRNSASIATSASKINYLNNSRTYTRTKNVPTSNEANNTLSVKVKSEPNSDSIADSRLKIIAEGQKKGAMDDYEVFCEKETNLRHLLDAFPGADIMEAQDILVRCKWDLKQAIQVAHQKPLKTTRKRFLNLGTALPGNDAKKQAYQDDEKDSDAESSMPSTSTKSEDNMLESSDEDMDRVGNHKYSNSRKNTRSTSSSNAPAAKRSRRLVPSSDSSTDEEDTLPELSNVKANSQVNSNEAAAQNNVKQTPVQSKSIEKQAVKPQSNLNAQAINNKQVAKSTTHTAAQSVNSIQVKSTPVMAQNANSKQNAKVSQTVSQQQKPQPSQSGNAQQQKLATSQSGIVQNAKSTLPQKTNLKEQDVSQTVSDKVETSSMSIESIPNLPKGLVITQIQAPKANQSSENMGTMALSKSISLTPVSIGSMSITPANVNSSTENSNVMTIKKTGDSFQITPSGSMSIQPVNNNQESSRDSSKSKSSKAKNTKKYDSENEEDEEYGNDDIYDSEDSDCDENLTTAHSAVLSFFQEATSEELATVPGCSKKKVDVILGIRPFKGWVDLVEKLKNDRALSPDLLNGAKKVIDMRNAISRLMAKCQQISLDMEDLVEDLKENRESSTDYVGTQPELLSDKMHLTSYQMLGLNWLLLMHNQDVNGILADEMGLGKTVQAIAFLAYLKEISISGPHLIVVPSSTLDNWKKEFEVWWPSVSIICYYGSQDSRRELRMQILNDEVDEFDVMVTTYNMVTSSTEDRNFFKRLEFHYVIFDEAHMLKNMASQRYQNLMRIRAPRRLLLTGTPLQNNLVELMSLLIFAMPHMFSGKTEQIKQMFSCVCKSDDGKSSFERERIEHAKRIMKPFVLRRLKSDVLKELPAKLEETKLCPLSEDQAQKYHELVTTLSEEVRSNKERDIASSGAGMMMQLRRAANHPLLLRRHFDDDKLLAMAKLMLKEPTHSQNDANLIYEDMTVMSDFELHKLCKSYKSLKPHILSDKLIFDSGKFKVLDTMLPKLIEEEHRILLFSQFTMVLDIVQEYMNLKNYKFLRLDGQVPVSERQQLIDEFNGDPNIPVFLLSTRAGGLGINLTAADTVILHDIDFNPYNDKQAEDRCHRVGQMRDVRVFRFISEDTIEEGILQRAKEKLKLERDIHAEDETEENDVVSVAKLLRDALGLKNAKS